MSMNGAVKVHGRYDVVCIGPDGNEKWRDHIDNVVATIGKNFALDTYLAGSAYTVTGPFMGLISSVSFSAVAAGDTMASHAGWLEAGSTNAPSFAARGTCAWSAAAGGSKALSANISFSITAAGTVQGGFIVFGSGAVNTLMSTAGVLYSAGTFATARAVNNGDTLQVSYTASM
jgi:hypothetical protein